MPKIDDRILLWRNTIQLFHNYKTFEGPFHKANFKKYHINPEINENVHGNRKTPDIIAVGDNSWLLVELTCDTISKEAQLNDYKKLDSRTFSSTYGYNKFTSPPETICSRLTYTDDGDHCQILVKDNLELFKEDLIKDKILYDALLNVKNKSLKRLPEIYFSLVPESKGHEIRRGIVDIVLQLFEPDCDGMTPYQICEKAFDIIFEKVSPISIEKVSREIEKNMEDLRINYLPKYIDVKDGRYCATEKFKQYPQTRKYIAKELISWAYPKDHSFSHFKEFK